jgi:hypothetical protein
MLHFIQGYENFSVNLPVWFKYKSQLHLDTTSPQDSVQNNKIVEQKTNGLDVPFLEQWSLRCKEN